MSTDQFQARMKILADLAGNVSTLAKKAGISQSGIRRYFGESEPTRPILIALSQATGVSALWLLDGTGPQSESELRRILANDVGDIKERSSDLRDTKAQLGFFLQTDLLENVITAVRDAASASEKTLSHAQEAEIITGVYEFSRILPPDTPIPTSAIHHFLKAIK